MHNASDIELKENNNNRFSDYYFPNNLGEPIRFLYDFNKINVIVGANNSGKSRFLRRLMNTPILFAIDNSDIFLERIDLLNNLIDEFDFKVKASGSTKIILQKEFKESNIDILKFDQNEILQLKKINTNQNINVLVKELKNNFSPFEKIKYIFKFYKENYSRTVILNRFLNTLYMNNSYVKRIEISKRQSCFDEILGLFEGLKVDLENYKSYNGNRIYIPTLRTAHSLFTGEEKNGEELISHANKKIKKDIFQETVRKNYNDLKEDVEIFTGLNLYNEILNVRNSVKEQREKFHAFEDFLSVNFFKGEAIDVVAEFNIDKKEKGIDAEDIIQVFIDKKSRELYNLGDGVQALIILMYKIFLANENSLIFIDEPELNLHPGFQRLFLEQITSNEELTKKNLIYTIVTHSNHFLDLTLEKDNISIYSFSPLGEDKFCIRNVNSGDNKTLRDLGVNNSSVFLANCSIWVEGISDRNFIKAFLKAYCKNNDNLKEPREDIDYAFFEYAGSNLQHYNFKKSESEYEVAKDLINSYALNNRVFLLSDLDSGTESRHNNLAAIADDLNNFNYLTTKPYREIENLLDNSIWERVLIDFCNKKKVEESEKDKVQIKIESSLKKTKVEKYKSNYIGEFLKDLNISELNKIWKVDKAGKAGTFIYKAELSKIVLDKVRNDEISWNDFSKIETIKKITENRTGSLEKPAKESKPSFLNSVTNS